MEGEAGPNGVVTRRQLLVGGGALGIAAALGIATTGSPFGGGTQTVTFWHLFGGGDGARLAQILGRSTRSTATPTCAS